MIAVPAEGVVKRIEASTGAKTSILSGLSYPNGLEVDRDNNVYVADQTTQKILRVNAYDQSDYEVIATGLSQPNGVILSPDETILYVGSFGGGKVYAIDRDPGGSGWLPHRTIFDSGGGDHGYDGINVDICGNVYFTEYIVGRVRRVTPDGSQVDGVVDLPSSWIPNLRWGNGIGGWDVDVLYVSDRDQGRLFALDMGIPGKKHVLIP